MQTPKIFKTVMLVAAVAVFPAANASAHGAGSNMMGQGGGMGPGMMGPGMMGQGYGMGSGMLGPGMMNMMPMMHGMMMGQGYGPGMMGQGYGMGPGMMGSGMMGSGMMGQGYGMGPGMMGPGMMGQGYGMGPGMMGPGIMGQGYGMGPGMMGAQESHEVTEDDVRGFLGRQLEMRGLSRLKVGNVDAKDERVFKVDIVTKENSLAARVVIDRRTGFPVAFE